MRPLAFCIPGDIELPTAGYRYDREVMARLPRFGVSAAHAPLGDGFPHPDDSQIAAAIATMAAAPRAAVLLIDGLALGALPPDAVAALPHRKIALVHHPLALEAGTPPDRAAFLARNEAEALAKVDSIVVTSAATMRILIADYGVPPGRIAVVEPGVERRERARGGGHPPRILAVGAVSPRKAHVMLVEAAAGLTDVDWRLTIAGSLDLWPETARELKASVERLGVAHRVELARRGVGRSAAAALRRSRHLRGRSPVRGLRHGALRGAGSRPSDRHVVGRGRGGDGPRRGGDQDGARRCRGPARSAPPSVVGRRLRRRMGDAAWAAAALLPDWDDAAREIAHIVETL